MTRLWVTWPWLTAVKTYGPAWKLLADKAMWYSVSVAVTEVVATVVVVVGGVVVDGAEVVVDARDVVVADEVVVVRPVVVVVGCPAALVLVTPDATDDGAEFATDGTTVVVLDGAEADWVPRVLDGLEASDPVVEVPPLETAGWLPPPQAASSPSRATRAAVWL